MSHEQKRSEAVPVDNKATSAHTGNASNPAPDDNRLSPSPGSQLLDEKAEKYLREVASIEDLPDAQDQNEMDETIKKEEGE